MEDANYHLKKFMLEKIKCLAPGENYGQGYLDG